MKRYRVRALVSDHHQVERDVEAMTAFGAVSLVTVDLWEDSREVTALTVWLLDDVPWRVDSSGCVARSVH